MSAEARRLFWWSGLTWITLFLLGIATVVAHANVSARGSTQLFVVSLGAAVVSAIEVKRGWEGFAIVATASISAYCLGTLTAFADLSVPVRIANHLVSPTRPAWIGGVATGFLVIELVWFAASRPIAPSPPGPPESAQAMLTHLERIEQEHSQRAHQAETQSKIMRIVWFAACTPLIAMAARKAFDIPLWVSFPLSALLMWTMIILGPQLAARISRRTNEELEAVTARVEQTTDQFKQLLREKAAAESKLNGENPDP